MSNLKRTPMYSFHKEAGAKLTPFAGFEMPLQYTSLIDEHMAVREKAGMFDVSHMGEFFVDGSDALEFVSKISSNDPSKLEVGQAAYSVFCNEKGGIIDDFLMYRIEENIFMLVVNAANIEKDFNWLVSKHSSINCKLENKSSDFAQIAIQGPLAQEILQGEVEEDLEDIGYYRFKRIKVAGVDSIVSRTGYTGEDGFEIYYPAEHGIKVWNALIKAGKGSGMLPVGLGARDTLRLEMGYALYGNDITEDTTPLEAGLGWITKLKSHDFIGKEALLKQKAEGVTRKLVGIVMKDRLIPRHGYTVYGDGKRIGQVTSGTFSPFLKNGIALGYVEVDFSAPGTAVEIEGRGGRRGSGDVTRPPFVRSNVRR